MIYFVPGRIEVVGKHTDYAGGSSLLCAVERGFTVTVDPRRDGRVCVRSAGSESDFPLDPDLVPEEWWRLYGDAGLNALVQPSDLPTDPVPAR